MVALRTTAPELLDDASFARLKDRGWDGGRSTVATNSQAQTMISWALEPHHGCQDVVLDIAKRMGREALNAPARDKEPPLVWACRNRYAHVEKLLELGVEVEPPPDHPTSALLEAASNCHSAILPLLEAGASLERQAGVGATPLALAAGSNAAAVLLLLTAGAQVNVRATWHQWTPLMLACQSNPSAVPLLLDAGADVHAHDVEGNTALMFACGNPTRGWMGPTVMAAIRSLLRHGAKVEVRNQKGEDALACGAKVGLERVLVLLRSGKALDLDPIDALIDAVPVRDRARLSSLWAWWQRRRLDAILPSSGKKRSTGFPRIRL